MNNKELHNLSDIIWNKIKGKPVPETWSDRDREEIIVRYWALGCLIDGTKSFSIEDERFDSIDVGGLYLPQKYTIVVNIENEILLVDFEPTF